MTRPAPDVPRSRAWLAAALVTVGGAASFSLAPRLLAQHAPLAFALPLLAAVAAARVPRPWGWLAVPAAAWLATWATAAILIARPPEAPWCFAVVVAAAAWLLAAPGPEPLRPPRWLPAGALALYALALTQTRPFPEGDYREYWLMTVSWVEHLSPDLRGTEATALRREADGAGLARELPALEGWTYFRDRWGRLVCYHAPFYSLVVAPWFALLAPWGRPWWAFVLVNGLGLLALAWRVGTAPLPAPVRRWLAAGLLASPIWFYLAWPAPEVLTYAALGAAVVDVLVERPARAALWAALAAIQNPTAVLFGVAVLAREAWRRRPVGPVVAALLPAALPVLWDLVCFGVPSLRAKLFCDPHDATVGKVVSLFADPNFGLVMYVPLLLVAAAAALRRHRGAWLWVAVAVAIAAADAVQLNWNNGDAHVHRFGVWLIPLLALAAVPWAARLKPEAQATLLALHLATAGVIAVAGLQHAGGVDYVHFEAPARWLLDELPGVYRPVPEVFAERTLHHDLWARPLPPVVWHGHRGDTWLIPLGGRRYRYDLRPPTRRAR